jgi:hypothetical protein
MAEIRRSGIQKNLLLICRRGSNIGAASAISICLCIENLMSVTARGRVARRGCRRSKTPTNQCAAAEANDEVLDQLQGGASA